MRSFEQHINVGFHYPVHFTSDACNPRNPLLIQTIQRAGTDGTEKVLFIIDSNVARHHPGLLDSIGAYCRGQPKLASGAAAPLVLPGGEVVKNDPANLTAAYQAIHRQGICRHSFIIAIGGGALLDVAGYAAATAHRGVRLIRMPTTVLSQNDSGVGVKNGINAMGKKNFLGAFAPPFAVINDWNFLTTLDQRDWLAGVSEGIKVGLIKDAAFYKFIEQNAGGLVRRDMPVMQKLIHRCAELHLNHIGTSGDPFEMGASRPLDFGHWAAHKLEQMTNFELRHGEAVAIGIALDVSYSAMIGWLSQDEASAIRRCLVSLNLPLYHEAMRDTATLLQGLEEFREHLGGRLTIMMLKKIGEGREAHEIDRTKMHRAIEQLAASAKPAPAVPA